MAHLPLAIHVGPPKSTLVICFGMGTTYRSALTWNIDTTAVELIPSVVEQFGFYHADAAECIANPKGHLIVDDGRRYLKRCGRRFDVIVVDPPPPVEAAGSSLLFSLEFYALAKQHLNKNGIVQMWFPGSDPLTNQAVLRSFTKSFPYRRCYVSMEGWGTHLMGSMDPIPDLNARQIEARMPESSRRDLLEWAPPHCNATAYIDRVIPLEYDPIPLLNADSHIVVTDDQPFNEYFLLRQHMR